MSFCFWGCAKRVINCIQLFYSDGKLDVVVPSFVHYLEVLEASDGDKMPGALLAIFFLDPLPKN